MLKRSVFFGVLTAFALPFSVVAAPVVSNVNFVQESDGAGQTRVRVTYDLATPNGPSAVSLLHSLDGGATYLPTTSTTGAVGTGITTGTARTIDWAVATDLPGQQLAGNFVVRVLAEDGVAIPLTITSTLAEGSVTQTATQTFTFTFGEAVTGFDDSDIAVTGGTKGAFTPVSATVYTLEVTGTGGTVTASVAADAAASVASGNTTLGGSYSNFYQDTWTINLPGNVPMELIRIPAGTFTMGSPAGPTPPAELSRNSDELQRTITLTQDFYLGKTEVTQRQWLAIQPLPWPGTAPSAGFGLGDNYPAYNVSHNDIGSWMTALNTHVTEPGTFSLPTEAQWEYACRAGTTTRFNFGDGFASNETSDTAGGRGDNMWFTGNNSPNGTKLVGQKPANAWGLHDMHGNVWEWCADRYGVYNPLETENPIGPGSGSSRVIRGGGWITSARFCRSALRNFEDPTVRGSNIGFRVLAVR